MQSGGAEPSCDERQVTGSSAEVPSNEDLSSELSSMSERDRSRYRTFAETVTSVLRSFDRAAEWADLLKYLQKLHKTLEKSPNFTPLLPDKLLLIRRLSQCLSPSLPGGLHLKALEVFQYLLETLGTPRLCRNLDLSVAFFPVFRTASIQVRHKFLEIVDRCYLPLGASLSPCLGPLVMALLPGIEEPNSEFYPLVMKTLSELQRSSGVSDLYRSMWLAILRAPHLRLPALHFLKTRLPSPPATATSEAQWVEEMQEYLPDRDRLVLQALVQSLQDGRQLCQRETLELICGHFKLRYGMFKEPQLHSLVGAALVMLTRREVALNRRLYAWLLGTESGSDGAVEYFHSFGREPTIAAVRDLFRAARAAQAPAAVVLKPIKVLECLVDRNEIGSQLVEEALAEVFALLAAHRPEAGAGPASSHDVVKQTQDFLDMLEIPSLWNYIVKVSSEKVLQLVASPPSSEGLATMVAVLDTMVPPSTPEEASEVMGKFMPRLLQAVFTTLPKILERGTATDLLRTLQLSLKILGKIPADTTSSAPDGSSLDQVPSPFPLSPSSQPSLPAFVPDSAIAAECLSSFTVFFCALESQRIARAAAASLADADVTAFELSSQMLTELFARMDPSDRMPPAEQWFESLVRCASCKVAAISAASIRTLLALVERPVGKSAAETCGGMRRLCRALASQLWTLLAHSLSTVHYDASGFFLALERLDSEAVHSELSSHMSRGTVEERVEACQRFTMLWRLSGELKTSNGLRPFTRALFLMLDTLQNDHPDMRLTGQSWLADSADKAERVLDPLLAEALDHSTVRNEIGVYAACYDTRRILYILRLLRLLFEPEAGAFAQRALQKLVSRDIVALNDYHSAASPEFTSIPVVHYIDLLTVMCLRYVQSTLPEGSDAESVSANAVVQTTAAELMHRLLLRVSAASSFEGVRIAALIREPVLSDIAQAISSSNLVLQVHLIGLLKTMVRLEDEVQSRPESGLSPALQQHRNHFQHSSEVLSPPTPLMGSPMFLQTLIIGLLQPPHKNLRSSWLDFLVTCLSTPAPASVRSVVVRTILDTLCVSILEGVPASTIYDSLPANDVAAVLRALTSLLSIERKLSQPQASPSSSATSLQGTATSSSSGTAVGPEQQSQQQQQQSLSQSGVAQTGSLALSGGLQTAVTSASSPNSAETSQQSGQQASTGTNAGPVDTNVGWHGLPGAFVGFLKDTFVGQQTQQSASQQSVLLEKLPVILRALLHVYGAPVTSATGLPASSSKLHNKYTLQDQVFRILDPIMQRHPTDMVRALLGIWVADPSRQRLCLEILNTMEAATEEVVLAACNSVLSTSMSRAAFARKSVMMSGEKVVGIATEERAVLDFVCTYVEQSVSVDGLCQAWPHFFALMRVAVAELWSNETAAVIMRAAHLYFTRVAAMEEKKGKRPSPAARKERQDLVLRLSDALLWSVGRPNHTPIMPTLSVPSLSLSVSPTAVLTPLSSVNSESVGVPASDTPSAAEELPPLSDSPRPQAPPLLTAQAEVCLDVIRILGTLLLPTLDIVYDDKDKLLPTLTNVVHHLFALLRFHWLRGSHEHVAVISKFVATSCSFPYAIRTWRKEVWDLFHDSDVFFSPCGGGSGEDVLNTWTVPINHLMLNDKLAYGDLIKAVTKAMQFQPGVIFGREANEGSSRGKHLRRLAFVIFSGAQDQYIRSLPVIKERVVEALKSLNTPLLQVQAFLCLRVMFLRFSGPNLLSFWPVVLTELMAALTRLPKSGSANDAEVLLGACKLVDMVLLLQDPNFSIHQWLFVSDPQQNRRGSFVPLIEQVSKMLSSTPSDVASQSWVAAAAQPGRPLITCRSMSDPGATSQIQQLLDKYSEAVYVNQVSAVPPDLESISQLIRCDFANHSAFPSPSSVPSSAQQPSPVGNGSSSVSISNEFILIHT